MMENIAVLGSTGSIGENTLRIVRSHPGKFRVKAIAAKKNATRLLAQAREFSPDVVCIYDASYALRLEKKLNPLGIRVVAGDEGLKEICTLPAVKKIIFAVVGAVGLKPILSAIHARKAVAVANKEPLVMAGALLMREAARFGVPILPIDSEHSGLWQCLQGQRPDAVKKLIITSSGGPFRTRRVSFEKITPESALKHPRWKMGRKITIDSATLMNKGLEVIEAAHLFRMPADRIEVLIHPEAVIHALVELVDGSHLAHLALTDMRLPIQFALSYPDRLRNHLPVLDLVKVSSFHFERPDVRRFPCLALGYEASRRGGTAPAVLNAANEVAVEAFLNYRIRFTDIPRTVECVLKKHRIQKNPGLSDILTADAWAREEAMMCMP
ncbi:MAG: 1-deoxy-D-xylulose-5-phosphate reductoisomerase [Candidatus Omnitrophica bacterium]|nr:1-deoxy-D-xylulose-5-phosphate reductoisomerase [Candidatus Omnitrophota bacterium]